MSQNIIFRRIKAIGLKYKFIVHKIIVSSKVMVFWLSLKLRLS